jgi:hypothetical protein
MSSTDKEREQALQDLQLLMNKLGFTPIKSSNSSEDSFQSKSKQISLPRPHHFLSWFRLN